MNSLNKIVVTPETKKHSEENTVDLFKLDKKSINVIIYCGYEGIEELVFASDDEEETRKKIMELKEEAKLAAVEASKYSEDQKYEMMNSLLDGDDEESMKRSEEYNKIFNSRQDPDRYCVMTYDGKEFKCNCNELGVSPKETWLY